ncbi:MAG: hypothetical protein ACK5NK_16240 [Niabella sp.]
MNLEYKSFLQEDFSPNSKVWVYQASRLLQIDEALVVEQMINEFVDSWLSHGDAVKGQGLMIFGYFVVLIADETDTAVGGCSTDGSVRFIKTLGDRLGVDFFDRNQLAFVVNDAIQILPYQQVQYAMEHNFLFSDSLYFNNLVSTKKELEENWIIPVKNSWLANKVAV